MRGSNHVIANVATFGICYIALEATTASFGTSRVAPITDFITHDWISDIGLPAVPLLVYALDAVAFLIASLLPDIDSNTSTLGRYMPFPGPHRGILHSIWPCIALLIAGFTCRVFMWVALGYFLHLFWDSFSAAGICWFYPLSQYTRYGNGAFVKKGRHLTLYRSSDGSEGVVIAVLVGVLVLLIMLSIGHVLPVSWDWSFERLQNLVMRS